MAILRGRKAPSPHDEQVADPRIWGRHYTGPHPWVLGLVVALILLALTYLAFAKEVPWADEGYTVKATFENAATLRETAPVRIAGVNVGEVTEVEQQGEAAEVTFTVNEEGRPLHADAEVRIRPRLFLEGNFFLDLRPGSPSAPELEDGGEIPVTRTSTAVQLDEVLTALQTPYRRGLQRALQGYGTALNYQPTAADDLTQDPDVAGETAAQSLSDALRYGGRAGRGTAIVSEALLGRNQHDLSGLIRSSGETFAKLESSESALGDLITNFNVTVGALAAESQNLSASIAELAPTLDTTEVSLRHLSDALPPLRTLAVEARPGIQELPDTIDAFGPWLDQTELLLRDRELGDIARWLKQAGPGLGKTAAGSKRLFPQLNRLGRCSTENLVPAADTVITADGFGTGQTNFEELFFGVTQLVGAGQPFDGNGPYFRLQTGGGPVLVQNDNPGGGFRRNFNFANTIEAPTGVQPALPSGFPPFRMDVKCHTNALPNFNGPPAAAGPPDLTPSP
ncbi:MAG TPA: MlaD family protein [Solirubrobacterales bacterium]|jgi:ABC-type transporter Mla subunit MlaD|nr:MlaD family protein [Solirubrobacterales bacterium]